MKHIANYVVAIVLMGSATIVYAQANRPGHGVTLTNRLPSTPDVAIRANDFLNSLGAGTKDIQGADTAQQIINGINYLGIRVIRDDATHNTTGPRSVQELCNIHAVTGVKVDELPIVDADPNNIADTKAEWDQLARCGAMVEAEGPNEPNNFHFNYQGSLCSMATSFLPCAKYQAALYAMVKADPALRKFPVLGLTEPGAEPDNVGLQFLTIPTGSGLLMPDGTVYADIANAHNYAQGNGAAGTTLIDNHARYAESVDRTGPYAGLWDLYGEYWGNTWHKGFAGASTGQNDRPKVTTETGWKLYKPNANIGLPMQGKLMNDVYLDAYQLGWSQTIVYQMFNHYPYDAGFGFFDPKGNTANASNATPMGRYLHNLTTILSDRSSKFSPGTVNYSISNLPATTYSMLMEKSNGTYELVIWGEAFASKKMTSLTINLGNIYRTVNVYDITLGSKPTQRLRNTSTIHLVVSDHPLIVEFRL